MKIEGMVAMNKSIMDFHRREFHDTPKNLDFHPASMNFFGLARNSWVLSRPCM
jgi:hypothetical protein